MMGPFIGALMGFLASVLPSAFNALAEWFEHRKDMDKGNQKIAAAQAGVAAASTPAAPVPPIIVAPDEDDEAGLERGAVHPLFPRALATFRAGLRPIITYGFFALFVLIKLKGMYHGLTVDNTPAVTLLPVLWDEGSQTLFAAVLAFWFGSRAIEKQQAAKATLTGKVSAGTQP
jgi:hypothetical protein